jgi:hypothetical protein
VRCKKGLILFFNSWQTDSCTFCLNRPDIDREFGVEGRPSGGVMFIKRLLPPFCYRFDLLTHFWINRIWLLARAGVARPIANAASVNSKCIFIVFLLMFYAVECLSPKNLMQDITLQHCASVEITPCCCPPVQNTPHFHAPDLIASRCPARGFSLGQEGGGTKARNVRLHGQVDNIKPRSPRPRFWSSSQWQSPCGGDRESQPATNKPFLSGWQMPVWDR